MKVLKIKKSAYSHLSISQNSNIGVPQQGTRVAACKRIFSYFEIVAGKVQPPPECPEAITITIQKYKVVRKCIENITLTIPVSLKLIIGLDGHKYYLSYLRRFTVRTSSRKT